jgi:hypothetical protein
LGTLLGGFGGRLGLGAPEDEQDCGSGERQRGERA